MLRCRPVRCSFVALGVLCAALVLPAAVNARSPGVKTLTDVGFASAAEHFEFSVRAEPALSPEAVSARRDGDVLMIRLDGVEAERRWLETEDAAIERTLLHPSRKRAPAAVVRVRLKRKVSRVALENIRVRLEGGAVVVAVPRDAAVARRWAAAPTPVAEAPEAVEPAPASAVKLTFAPLAAEPAELAPPAAIAAPDEALAAGDGPLAVAEAPAAAALPAAPLDPADTPLGLDEPAPAEGGDVALSAGLAQVGGPGVGAFLMSLAFLGAVGFLMWRKMRGNRATATGRPLIRPVGSHMLGPKQSLLLVDVAGEMVLLGTTDKGVQMLTKIERREAAEGAAAASVAPAEAEAGGFAERLGAAVSRFRTAAARLDRGGQGEPVEGGLPEAPAAPRGQSAADRAADRAAERRFFAREKAAVQEAADEDALAALADRVEDAPDIDPRRLARTRFAPIEPTEKRRPSAPPLDPTADLLRKIRSLQRA